MFDMGFIVVAVLAIVVIVVIVKTAVVVPQQNALWWRTLANSPGRWRRDSTSWFHSWSGSPTGTP